MPYIKPDRRKALAKLAQPENAGELNYLFSRIVTDYLIVQGQDYQHINDCIGALEGAKLELYRRVAVPYEDGKIKINGDVYPSLLTEEG